MAFLQHADWKVELCTGSAVPDLKLITAEQLETSSAIKRGAEDILRRVLRPLESDLPTIQRQLAINVHGLIARWMMNGDGAWSASMETMVIFATSGGELSIVITITRA